MISVSCHKCGHHFHIAHQPVDGTLCCPECKHRFSVSTTPRTGESIAVTCPQCEKRLLLSDPSAGKRVRCMACEGAFIIVDNPWRLTAADRPQAPVRPTPPPVRQPIAREVSGYPSPPPIPTTPTAAVPPPLPPSSPQPPVGTDDILASYQPKKRSGMPGFSQRLSEAYQQTAKPGLAGLWRRLRQKSTMVKNHAIAMRLKHEIRGLQNGIDEQRETLGTLCVSHRPPQVNLDAELAELGQIQQQLNEKQATLQSLQNTQGSGQVVKQMKQEIAQLHDRQHTLMVALGTKAQTSHADLPGAEPHYNALAQLEAALTEKQQRLATLESELGPVLSTSELRSIPWQMPAIVVAAAFLGVFVLYGMWVLAAGWFTPSVPAWATPFLPDDAAAVACIDVASFLDSDLYAAIEDEALRGTVIASPELPIDELEYLVVAATDDGETTLVFRTQDDLPLEDFAGNHGDDDLQEYQDVAYLRSVAGLPVGCLAKVADRTFCASDSEAALKKALGRWKRGDRAQFEDLQRALRYARGDSFIVGRLDAKAAQEFSGELPFGLPLRKLEAFALSWSCDSSIEIEGALILSDEKDAERIIRLYQDALDSFAAMAEEGSGQGMGDMKEVVDLASRLKLTQEGEVVRFDGSWSFSELEDPLQQGMAIAGESAGRGRRSPRSFDFGR